MNERFAALALAVALTSCGAALPAPVATIPPPKTNTATAFYIHIGPPSVTTPATIAAIRAARFDGIRTDYYPRRWSYEWVHAAIANGLKMVLITPHPTLADLADPSAYIADMTAGERAFPGQSWELVNEPDATGGAEAVKAPFQLTAAQYVAFFQAVIPHLRAADPTATLILGGVASGGTAVGVNTGIDFAWINAVHSLWAMVDQVGIHPYPPPWLGTPIDALPSILAQVTQLTGKPAVVTEWGLIQSSGPPDPTMPLANPLTQEQAASQVAHMVSIVDGKTPLFTIYEWDNADNPWASSEVFGLIGTPALAAFTAARR